MKVPAAAPDGVPPAKRPRARPRASLARKALRLRDDDWIAVLPAGPC